MSIGSTGSAVGTGSGVSAGEPAVPGDEPVIRVVSGNPSAEEIAVLVAVLASAGGDADPAPPARRSAWSDPRWRLIGPATRVGGWRASGLPH